MSSTPLTLFHSTCLHTHTASWGTNLERHSCLRQEVTNPARCGIQVPSISVAAIAVNNVYRISSPQINNFIHWSVWSILARGTALYTGRALQLYSTCPYSLYLLVTLRSTNKICDSKFLVHLNSLALNVDSPWPLFPVYECALL